jgi:dihydroorotate dehydrogenase electron transfer subunit
MAVQTYGTVIENRNVQSAYYLLEIEAPSIAQQIQPGEFVMVQTARGNDPILKRPFSVFEAYPDHAAEIEKRGRLSLLYKKVGKGTDKMTELAKGQKIDLIGPLGRGFRLPSPPSSPKAVLVGGGMGIVSLYPLVKSLDPRNVTVFIGGKSESDILCADDFRARGAEVWISTEDGSLGTRGTVIELFVSMQKTMASPSPPYLYACGPLPMLKALARKVRPAEWVGEVSLEARMGCGFGACWGCVVKTKNSKAPYQRVCKEGTVFSLEEIDWRSL